MYKIADDLNNYRARIGGFHSNAAKLSNKKLSSLNKFQIHALISLVLNGLEGLPLALLIIVLQEAITYREPFSIINNSTPDTYETCVNHNTANHHLHYIIPLHVILLHLAQSGDIETNPGPNTYKTIDDISMIHANVKSLRNKIDQVSVEATNHDIVTISETWLNKSISNENIKLPGFHPPTRKDREDGYGGVAIYIRNCIPYKERPDLTIPNLEAVWAEIVIKNEPFLIGSFYRPPSSLVPYWRLIDESIKQAMSTPTKIFILGDFNSNYLAVPMCPHLLNLIQFNNLTQLVTDFTRIEDDKKSCIDLILTSCPNLVSGVEVLPEICSDHKVSCAKLKLQNKRHTYYKRTLMVYSKLNKEMYLERLRDTNLLDIINNSPIEESARKFSECLLENAKLCMPIKTITLRDNSAPWINEYILNLRQQKLEIHIVAKRLDTPEQWAIFRQIRNYYTDEIRNRKREYLLDLDENISCKANFNTKNWWKIVNSFLKNKGMESDEIPAIKTDGTFLEKNLDKANHFNATFKKQSTLSNCDDPLPVIPFANEALEHIVLTTDEVEKNIKHLNIRKAVGPDLIHNRLLIAALPEIISPLTTLFNKSLSQGIFPSIWKTAHVTPIYKKKGDRSICTNYRPISLLSCVGKLLEKCVQKRLFSFIKTNNIITPSQSGFTPGDSTVYQLLFIYDDFCKSLDNATSLQAIFFDISKAFDKVWHRGLLHKLNAIGIRGQLLTWFQNYLDNRSQAVVIKGSKSDYLPINAGVPQGSVLGPILFLVYINDITKDITSTIKLFADDTSTYLSLNDNITRGEILNSDLNKIHKWATEWKVSFAPEKTDLLNVCQPNRNLDNILKFSNSELSPCEYHKHLGIILQGNCKWDNHIRHIQSSCRTLINCLRSFKYRLNRKSLEIMYKSFILPLFDYADIIYDNCTQTQAESLEELHLDALRTIIGTVRGTSHELIYIESGFIPLKERRKRHKLLLYFKFVNNRLPNHINTKFPALITDHNPHHLRRPLDRYIPGSNTELYKNSFFLSTTSLWNELPEDIQATNSLSFFKRYLNRNDKSIPPHYYTGNRLEQVAHCKLRLGMSDLNYDLVNRHLRENARCNCGADNETANHFFLECNKYTVERSITIFHLPPLSRNTHTLLYGSPEYSLSFNDFIFSVAQEFIQITKRFAQ